MVKVALSGKDEPLLADVTVGAAVLIKGPRAYTLVSKLLRHPRVQQRPDKLSDA